MSEKGEIDGAPTGSEKSAKSTSTPHIVPKTGLSWLAASFPSNEILGKKQDDDDHWTMVLYNEHKKGGQGGGGSRKASGLVDVCVDIQDASCANPTADGSVPSVGSTPTGDECTRKQVRHDSNGVDIDDEIRFVQVRNRDG